MKDIDDMYVNFWGKPQRKFTEMEIALMEGGHSLKQEAAESKFAFFKKLLENKNESK